MVHHSSQPYNFSTALRQSWTGTITGWIFWMWLPLVGSRPAMVLTMQATSLLYQFWIHTELVHGPLEFLLNTPSWPAPWIERALHRLEPCGTLIIWDRLFSTFELEDLVDRPRFGLTKNNLA